MESFIYKLYKKKYMKIKEIGESLYLLKPKQVFNSLKYLIDTEPGSVPRFSAVTRRQPLIAKDEYIADLHAHPYISGFDDLIDTFKVMHDNNVELLAITTHGKGDQREHDYWTIKDSLKNSEVGNFFQFEDKGKMFSVTFKDKKLSFVGAYEMYVYVPGVKGRVDIVSLMPEQGFEKKIVHGLNLHEYLEINDDHNATVFGAHPYTIWDPHGPNGILRFRLANENERKYIQDHLFPNVDSVDRVSSNCIWMSESDKLLFQDYGKTLTNSDAHSKTPYNRREIGRSGNIFKKGRYLTDAIKGKEHRNYHFYTPIFQFATSIAFDNPKNFP